MCLQDVAAATPLPKKTLEETKKGNGNLLAGERQRSAEPPRPKGRRRREDQQLRRREGWKNRSDRLGDRLGNTRTGSVRPDVLFLVNVDVNQVGKEEVLCLYC